MALVKGPYEPAINDVIAEDIGNKGLYKKYQCDLNSDEFNKICDELEEGYFKWNNDGHLALTAEGLEYPSKFHKS